MEETNSVNGRVEDVESIKQRDSQTPLTVPSQTPGIETNEIETLLGQESEDSPDPDLFKGTSVKEADYQPKDTEENTFSDTQLTALYNTMKTNQDRRIELEKNQLENRLLQEEALLQESWEQEDAELEREWWKRGRMEREYYEKRFREKEKRLREEEEERIREEEEHSRQHEAETRAFQQKCEEIHQKRKQEMERLHRRRDLLELGNRSQREQLELDLECSETLVEKGLANTSSIKNIDRPLNKLVQVAITPSANSNAVPGIAMPNITTVPASTSVQSSTPLQPMTCKAANQQNRIMTTSNAAVPNSGPAVNAADSYPSSKIRNTIVDGIDAGQKNSVRSETLRKMKNLGMDVDKLNIWKVIVNPDGVSTTLVNRNMDRGCLICSSDPFTETGFRSKKVKINGEESPRQYLFRCFPSRSLLI